ncbi:MAG: Gellan lyase [Bacteroidota bacterium]|nr:MAG: Gellan lyase [Bacteroidota bacterium]
MSQYRSAYIADIIILNLFIMYIFTFLIALCATFAVGQTTSYPVYEGVFGGTTHVQSITFPTGAEAWAGFSNNNTEIYPLSFANGGKITFKASASAAANLKFRFEANPHPNVEPSYDTANTPITAAVGTYTVTIPTQGANTFNSALLYIVERDITVNISEVKITANAGDPNTNATLSDLQVDNTTIAGFSGTVTSYTYKLPKGTITVPQITTATATQAAGGATTTITQATAIPGNATVLVTAPDGTTTETYTVSFKDVLPSTAAPTPPARNAADVISLYSDAYTDVASNFDAGWCGANSVEEISVAGNATTAFLGNACQGIVLNTAVDASTFTNYHVDIFIEAGTDLDGKTFNLKFVGTPTSVFKEVNHDLNALQPNVGEWVSFDGTVDLSTMGGFKEFGVTTNLANGVYYDNLYAYKGTPLSLGETDNGISIYPNPFTNHIEISAAQAVNQVRVYNIAGQEVLQAAPHAASFRLDTTNLSKGVYLLSLESNGKSTTAKMVK